MVVIPGKIRVQALKPKPLEQMSLPQIADVVVNAAAVIPARHRPYIAGQHRKTYEAAGNFQMMHRVVPARSVQIVVVQTSLQGSNAKSLPPIPYRQVLTAKS